MRDFWPKSTGPEIIAGIQTIQDSLARLENIYMSVIDLEGNPLTIPSNQPYICLECLNNYSEVPCSPILKQAIAETVRNKKTISVHCPFKLLTYFTPLGILSGNSLSNINALLTVGKIPPSDKSFQNYSSKKIYPNENKNSFPIFSTVDLEKLVATFGKIFDLIFFLIRNPEVNVSGNAESSSTDTLLIDNLSKREREVLNLVGLGLSNRVIAKRLFISEATVKTHIYNLTKKINVNNRTELALFFIQSLQK